MSAVGDGDGSGGGGDGDEVAAARALVAELKGKGKANWTKDEKKQYRKAIKVADPEKYNRKKERARQRKDAAAEAAAAVDDEGRFGGIDENDAPWADLADEPHHRGGYESSTSTRDNRGSDDDRGGSRSGDDRQADRGSNSSGKSEDGIPTVPVLPAVADAAAVVTVDTDQPLPDASGDTKPASAPRMGMAEAERIVADLKARGRETWSKEDKKLYRDAKRTLDPEEYERKKARAAARKEARGATLPRHARSAEMLAFDGNGNGSHGNGIGDDGDNDDAVGAHGDGLRAHAVPIAASPFQLVSVASSPSLPLVNDDSSEHGDGDGDGGVKAKPKMRAFRRRMTDRRVQTQTMDDLKYRYQAMDAGGGDGGRRAAAASSRETRGWKKKTSTAFTSLDALRDHYAGGPATGHGGGGSGGLPAQRGVETERWATYADAMGVDYSGLSKVCCCDFF